MRGAMKPLAGDFAFVLFAAGLFNASVFSASILPLSTAYTVCEGWASRAGWTRPEGSSVLLLVLHALIVLARACAVAELPLVG